MPALESPGKHATLGRLIQLGVGMKRQDSIEAVGGVTLLALFMGVMHVVDHAYGVPLGLHMLIISGPAHVVFSTLARRRRQRRR